MFGEFLDRLEREALPSHDMVFPVGDVLPELVHEFVMRRHRAKVAWLRARRWRSASHTASTLRRDLPDNVHAQICGKKPFVLMRPNEPRDACANPLCSRLPDFSPVDRAHVDCARFPRMRGVPSECEVAAGEMPAFMAFSDEHRQRM